MQHGSFIFSVGELQIIFGNTNHVFLQQTRLDLNFVHNVMLTVNILIEHTLWLLIKLPPGSGRFAGMKPFEITEQSRGSRLLAV